VLACLAWIAVRESGARTATERVVAALTPVAMYATAITIGNGQLTLHVLAALMAGMVLLLHGTPSLGRDLAAATLIAIALAKPTVTAPLFWAVLLVPGRVRPAVLTCLLYAALTAFAAAFQQRDTLALVAAWLQRGMASAGRGAITGGYANVQSWLAAAGLDAWSGKAALAMLGGLGVWTFVHRRADPWIVLGVGAVVARLWTYHRIYDDALLLLPMIALARIATGVSRAAGSTSRALRSSAPSSSSTARARLSPPPAPYASEPPAASLQATDSFDGSRVTAAAVLALAWAASQTPARFHSAGPPYELIFNSAQTVVWITVLAFLLSTAAKARVPVATVSGASAAAA
jgi:hypothetical protein